MILLDHTLSGLVKIVLGWGHETTFDKQHFRRNVVEAAPGWGNSIPVMKQFYPVLQIRRGKRDNFGIIFHKKHKL